MAKTITRRGFLRGLGALVLAGATLLPGFSAELSSQKNPSKPPLESLERKDKTLVHSVLTRGSQQLYLIGENHDNQDVKAYARIIDNEFIDCVFLEGLEGKIDDDYIKKINRDFERFEDYISFFPKDPEKGELTPLDLKRGIYYDKNNEIIIPKLDFEDWTTNIPGAAIARLITTKCKTDMYGIDDFQYMRRLYIDDLKYSFKTALESLERDFKKEDLDLNKREKEWENLEFSESEKEHMRKKINERLKKYETLKRNLNKKREEARSRSLGLPDNEKETEMVVNNTFVSFYVENHLRKRDEYAVREISRIMSQNPYKRGLVIRGEAHINYLRPLLAKEGFISGLYNPDKPAIDINKDLNELISRTKQQIKK